MNNSKFSLPIRTISVLLWWAGFFLPAYVSDDLTWPKEEHVNGSYCFFFGPFTAFSLGFFSWLSNFFLFYFIIMMNKNSDRAKTALYIGTVLAPMGLFFEDIWINEGGVGPRHWHPGIGQYLWVMSFLVPTGYCLFVDKRSRAVMATHMDDPFKSNILKNGEKVNEHSCAIKMAR